MNTASILVVDDEPQLRRAMRATLADLGSKLARRSVQQSPFVDAPRVKGAHWAKPDLVANIAFTEWTSQADDEAYGDL